MKKPTLEELRKQFPRPTVSNRENLMSGYCVGGALCGFYGMTFRFPTRTFVGNVIKVNLLPGKPDDMVYDLAAAIATANDRGDFERAWTLLGHALEGKLPPEFEEPK